MCVASGIIIQRQIVNRRAAERDLRNTEGLLSSVVENIPAMIISVADTGTGISPENRKRVFEPFFSTKDKDKGTGLGLSVLYGILKSHQGFVDLKSELKKGTTFHLYFPVQPV